jgi:hypothetical protein
MTFLLFHNEYLGFYALDWPHAFKYVISIIVLYFAKYIQLFDKLKTSLGSLYLNLDGYNAL